MAHSSHYITLSASHPLSACSLDPSSCTLQHTLTSTPSLVLGFCRFVPHLCGQTFSQLSCQGEEPIQASLPRLVFALCGHKQPSTTRGCSGVHFTADKQRPNGNLFHCLPSSTYFFVCNFILQTTGFFGTRADADWMAPYTSSGCLFDAHASAVLCTRNHCPCSLGPRGSSHSPAEHSGATHTHTDLVLVQ